MKFFAKIIAVVILVYGLFLTLGAILSIINASYGLEKMNPLIYERTPWYVLLIISAWGILKTKRWAVYLLFTLLAYDIFSWIIHGYFLGMFQIAWHAKHSILKVYGVFLIFYKKLLVPILLFTFFPLPKVREQFSVAGPASERATSHLTDN